MTVCDLEFENPCMNAKRSQLDLQTLATPTCHPSTSSLTLSILTPVACVNSLIVSISSAITFLWASNGVQSLKDCVYRRYPGSILSILTLSSFRLKYMTVNDLWKIHLYDYQQVEELRGGLMCITIFNKSSTEAKLACLLR